MLSVDDGLCPWKSTIVGFPVDQEATYHIRTIVLIGSMMICLALLVNLGFVSMPFFVVDWFFLVVMCWRGSMGTIGNNIVFNSLMF